ncbi:MAG TPA: inositol monophosphatase family protein [Marmoricola sp.]|nr:inositol monophosphatase [Nocardioidaceae bacterium]HNA99416.1 inositol monophosphatase family protein [Marmoricola sp.]MCO5323321.1 inositol monophosphatase [Nocardioidaceae bacterium]HNI71749.1 inositol monophosphatase family protein [Marmoricola sp.]HNJ77746.1 inositol monophosphatase family protein [Marmoricola sp.]
MDTDEVLELLKRVAAEVITPRFRALMDTQIKEKRPGDLVTVADHEAEELITQALLQAYPDAVVLGEEAHSADPSMMGRFRYADHAFTVDPVDGTKNFVNGSPDHAVMVSEVRMGTTQRAWIWQPEHQTSWTAELGAGVRRNGVLVNRPATAEPPVGATSIWSRRGRIPEGLPALIGSWICCGVDYPHLIEGDCDYLVYGHTNPWDHLPGSLLLHEVGGVSAHRDGTPYDARSTGRGLIAAADPQTLARAVTACERIWPDRPVD